MDRQGESLQSIRRFDESGPTVASAVATTIPVGGSVYVGIGYEPRTNTARNRAIKKDPTVQKIVPSIRPEYVFEYVEDYSRMANTLSLSLSAAYGAQGISGGSASLSLFKSTTIERSSAYVVFKMRMIAKEETIENAILVDDILRLISKKQYSSLVEKYGTCFARTVRYGGELAAILEFTSNSQTDLEKFHSEIKGAVGAARGEANMETSVMKVTSGRSVKITYAQSGGSTGNNQDGVFTITTESLIERIRGFPNEVKGTTGLDGSTVPITADMASLREAINWPADNNTNLDYPYPPDIESTAFSIDMLHEKLVAVESILSSTAVLAPSLREAASAMRPYLLYQISESRVALAEAMSSTISPITVSGESFFQYRVRNFLGVASSATRENAGGDVDLTEPDKGLLARRLFGEEVKFDIKPWPEVSFSAAWGYQGEHDGAGGRLGNFAVGHHIPCPQDGGNAEGFAAQLAGKASPDAQNDGVFAYLTRHPSAVGGNRCGYSLLHFSAFRISVPDRSLLPPLPSIPQNKVSASLQQEPAKNLGTGKWMLLFSVTLPTPRSCGSYTVTANLKSKQSNTKQLMIPSYWISTEGAQVHLSQTLSVDAGWEVSSFSVKVDSAYSD